MKAAELKEKLNNELGYNPWPKSYEVDAETYGNCCQDVFNSTTFTDWANITGRKNILWRTLALGPHNGLMFENVELILKREKE